MVFVDTSGAIIAARARRELIEFFEQRGALDLAHATQFDFPSRMHEDLLGTLVGKGIVKQTMEGRYWLDREALQLDQARQAQAARTMLIIVAALIALAVAATAIIQAMKQG